MRKGQLQCPFCENFLTEPIDIRLETLELTGGMCTCTAVYVFDRSGYNLGSAFMDALVLACKEDYDKAISLSPEEYETETLDYDPHLNTACISRDITRKSPKLFFVRIKKTENTH